MKTNEEIRKAFEEDYRDIEEPAKQRDFSLMMDRVYAGSKVYASGFFAGYLAAETAHREEVNELAGALKRIQTELNRIPHNELGNNALVYLGEVETVYKPILSNYIQVTTPCPACQGGIAKISCKHCNGTGEKTEWRPK